jgi:hypothetical protein
MDGVLTSRSGRARETAGGRANCAFGNRERITGIKKASGFFIPEQNVNYRLVRQSQKEAIPVQHNCRVLGVSGAGQLCGGQRADRSA